MTLAELAERITLNGSFDEVNEYFYDQGWTDGLPIVPPTEERVAAMLAYTDRAPAEVVGEIAPGRGDATVERIAINAVMAGCRPEYLPVLIAAAEALADPKLNLNGVQATTNPVAPLLIVNGPIANELVVNAAGNAFGQGWRANATLGRAVRLLMINVGHGLAQTMDKSTQGQPAKYTFCVAENEAASPWEPLHVERGFPADVSVVSFVSATGTQNILELASQTAAGVLQTLAGALTAVGMQNTLLGGGPLLALCPEQAEILAAEGWTKRDVKQYLYEHGRTPLSAFSPENVSEVLRKRRPKWAISERADSLVPPADSPDDINIIVVGGPGPHSQVMPSFGESFLVSRPILRRDGSPVASVEDFRR